MYASPLDFFFGFVVCQKFKGVTCFRIYITHAHTNTYFVKVDEMYTIYNWIIVWLKSHSVSIEGNPSEYIYSIYIYFRWFIHFFFVSFISCSSHSFGVSLCDLITEPHSPLETMKHCLLNAWISNVDNNIRIHNESNFLCTHNPFQCQIHRFKVALSSILFGCNCFYYFTFWLRLIVIFNSSSIKLKCIKALF